MSNSVESVKKIQKAIDELIEKLKGVDKEIVKSSESARTFSDAIKKASFPKEVSDEIDKIKQSQELLIAKTKERKALQNNLVKTTAKLELAETDLNKALIKQRTELQQQTKLIKETAVISSRYSTLLQKTSALRNKEARIIQDLNLKKALGNKLNNEEQKELKQSELAFKKYNKAVRSAKESVGRFQENVGNYPKLLGSITDLTKGLIGSFGVIEGIRLAFDFAGEAVQLAREAKGVEFAFNRLGIEGVEAFNDIKKASRGTLSDLEIKKSLNEFKNLGIQLKTSGVAFEFLAVRAAQTGRSVESMREDLVTGLGRGSVRILDNLGLSMAELNKLTKEQGLSTQEAFGVIAQKEIEKAGDILDEAAASQQQFNAAFENFKVSAGSGFIGNLTNDMYKLGTAFLSVSSDINTVSDGFVDFLGNIGRYLQGQGAAISMEAMLKKELEKRPALVREIINLQKEQGTIELQLRLNREKLLKTNSEELAKILKSLQIKKEEKKVTVESVAFLRKKITTLREEQEQLTINDKARSNSINNEIKQTQALIDSILGIVKAREKINTLTDPFKEALNRVKDVEKAFNNLFSEELKIKAPDLAGVESATLRFSDLVDKDVIDKMYEAFDTELLREGLNNLSGTINQFTGINSGVLDKFFDGVTNGFDDIGDLATSSFDVIGEASNAYFEGAIAEYDRAIEANTAYFDKIINNELLSDEVRKKAQKDKEEREKKLTEDKRKEQRKQAEINKALAITQILINTAVGVSEALSTANIPLAITLGILGAAELAVASSAKIPAFKDGHLAGTAEGDALINDSKSNNYVELVERKNGALEMYQNRNQIIKMNKGDKVHKAGSQRTNQAKNYIDGLSDNDLIKNIESHSMAASLQANMNIITVREGSRIIRAYEYQTDRIIKELRRNKTNITLNNNNSIGEDLAFLKMGDF